MHDPLLNDIEKIAKELAIQAGFRIAYSAYNIHQGTYWSNKTLSEINENLVKKGPAIRTRIYGPKSISMLPIGAKMDGKDMYMKTGSFGFTTPDGKTSPLDETLIEITKDTTAYIEMVGIDGIIHKFSDLLWILGATGTIRLWRHTDSSRMMNLIRSEADGDAIAEGEVFASIQALDTLCGTLMSDDNREVVICDARIISTSALHDAIYSIIND